jgi:tetratricopeptide (TPR) repeat protein
MKDIGDSVAFRLRGHQSNRDAIGASVTLETGTLRQTKYLQAGTGFLAQHSKELFFGIGKPELGLRATVRWPNGLSQHFENLPINHRIEIEEGSNAFVAKPFVTAPSSYAHAGPLPQLEPLPSRVGTWLIEPLKAPGFSLPDLTGSMRELQQSQGSFVLLNFWTAATPLCRDQLKLLDRHHSEYASHLNVLAVNVDSAGDIAAARSLAAQERLSFPVLFATDEVAGIYNIIYRYMFDRRRDLALPTSFLLDRDGMIVKLYQGEIDPQNVLEDVRSIPTTTSDRMKKALPWSGQLYQSTFMRNDFTYGVALFQHGYLDQAAESFQQVIAAKPGDPEAYYNLGTLNLRRNDLEQARHYLEQTVKLKPDYPEAWNNLGMIAAQQQQTDQAIKDFQQSIVLRPDYAIALLNLGNVYRRERAFEKAGEVLMQALKIQPDNPEISYSLGMLDAEQNQMQPAADYLQKAIELRPNYPEARNNLGILFVQLQDYSKAEQQFKACINVAPTFDQAYLNLARLYAMQNKSANARDILQELLRIKPGSSEANQLLQMLH